ncbi:hypothetical protein PTTG_00407, partial [Puccinia triticina 1-1 BBBD Race 1]
MLQVPDQKVLMDWNDNRYHDPLEVRRRLGRSQDSQDAPCPEYDFPAAAAGQPKTVTPHCQLPSPAQDNINHPGHNLACISVRALKLFSCALQVYQTLNIRHPCILASERTAPAHGTQDNRACSHNQRPVAQPSGPAGGRHRTGTSQHLTLLFSLSSPRCNRAQQQPVSFEWNEAKDNSLLIGGWLVKPPLVFRYWYPTPIWQHVRLAAVWKGKQFVSSIQRRSGRWMVSRSIPKLTIPPHPPPPRASSKSSSDLTEMRIRASSKSSSDLTEMRIVWMRPPHPAQRT